MSPIEDCCYRCSECERLVCGDDQPKCPHEFPACDGCCEMYHEEMAA